MMAFPMFMSLGPSYSGGRAQQQKYNCPRSRCCNRPQYSRHNGPVPCFVSWDQDVVSDRCSSPWTSGRWSSPCASGRSFRNWRPYSGGCGPVAPRQPNVGFEDVLREVIHQLGEAFKSQDSHKENTDVRNHGESCCRSLAKKVNIWSETIDLPEGYTLNHLENIKVKDGKVAFELVKHTQSSEESQSEHYVRAVRSLPLPLGIISPSLKILLIGSNKVKVVGRVLSDTDQASKNKGDSTTSSESKADKVPKTSADDTKTAHNESETVAETAETTEDGEESTTDQKVEDSCCLLTQVADERATKDSETGDFVIVDEEGSQKECPCDDFCLQNAGEDADKKSTCQSQDCECETLSCGYTTEAATNETEQDSTNNTPEESDGSWPRSNNKDENDDTLAPETNTTTEEVSQDQEFQQVIDVTPFDVQNITMKLSGNDLLIDAVQKDDKEMTSLEMHRSIRIPDTVNTDQLKCRETKDRQLQIVAPYLTSPKTQERILRIEL